MRRRPRSLTPHIAAPIIEPGILPRELGLSYKHIIVERDESVVVIILNRPRVLKAWNKALLHELEATLIESEVLTLRIT